MRRRSERTRSTSSPASVERPTRRSSRRGKKSPSRSPQSEKNHEDKVSETEIDGDKKHRDSSSDRDSEDNSSRSQRRSRTRKLRTSEENSPAKRKRGSRLEKERVSPIIEENGSEVEINEQDKEVTEEKLLSVEKINEAECEKIVESRKSFEEQCNVEDKIQYPKEAETQSEELRSPESRYSNENDTRRKSKSSSSRGSSEKEDRRRKHKDDQKTSDIRSSETEDRKYREEHKCSSESEDTSKKPREDRTSSDVQISLKKQEMEEGEIIDEPKGQTGVSKEPDENGKHPKISDEEQHTEKSNTETNDKRERKLENSTERSDTSKKIDEKKSDEEKHCEEKNNRQKQKIVIEGKPRERRSRFDDRSRWDEPQKKINEKENEHVLSEFSSTPREQKSEKPVRKRKWMTRKSSECKPQVLAISTDSLKNLISDVQPVPLSDIKLESSPEPEAIEIVIKEEIKEKEKPRNRERRSKDREARREEKPSNRKVSIIDDSKSLQRPPSPPRNVSSNVLYITNLVRPFTVLQLKGLLARTGKIVENGFWIDRIKSKCYVKYETEDQAIETRHALHGVRWPTSNPKCLNVDFGTEIAMEKAITSTLEEGARFGADGTRENRLVGTGWDKERFDFDEKKDVQVSRPVREWDVGKKEELERELERSRERERERERERRRHSIETHIKDRRRSTTASPVRKFKKKENDPPLRLLDDLFRKTKTTPCIYWLPLTPEQIIEKEEARRKRMEEHEELRKQREREREREREKERDREKEREKERERRREHSNDRRRSRSRDRRRY